MFTYVFVYLVLWADFLRGRLALFSPPCGSPQTGSGPLLGPMYLLCCKKALDSGTGAIIEKVS